MIALIDIDGTIADLSHRLKYITPPWEHSESFDEPVDAAKSSWKPNWDGFFNAMIDDIPIPSMVTLVKAIAKTYDITYITGRPESHRRVTLDWLVDYALPRGVLVMRKTGDYRPDFKVKRELYEQYVVPFVGNADLVIEDRDQVVEMWRSLGITCLQPCKGSY